MNPINMKRKKQAGFTIIELLIATAIFAIIMIVITVAVLQFSRQYYKGVVSSSTQSTARTLIDDVTRAIQFNGGAVSVIPNGYCIGTAKRYSYALNRQVIDNSPDSAKHQGLHGLVSDTVSGCNTSTTALPVASLGSLTTPNARELLGQRMRLTKFDITNNSELYTITVRIVYGDDEVLTSTTDPNMSCKSNAGSQFCAVSELTTSVRKRAQ